MNLSGKIYSKTGKGAQALSSKSRALSSDSKKILASIDGKTDVETLMEQFDKLPDEAFNTMISQLEADGYIRFVKNKDWEFDDDDIGASSAMVVDELSPEDFFALTSQATPESKSPPTVEPETVAKENEAKVSPSPSSESKSEKKARQETERKAHEEAEQLAREDELTRKEAEAEVVAKASAAKLVAERLIREEEARQKAETEARLEAERLAREEDAHKQAEAEMRTKVEHEAKLEAERKEKHELERKAREDAERKARQEEEARQKADAEARTKVEKEARLEAERIAKEEAKRKADEEKSLRQKVKDEERAIAAKLAKEQAEQKTREKAERKAREDAERKARQEEDARQKAEAEARAKIEKEARLEAERIAKEEEKRKADVERALHQKAKEEARAIAEEAARAKAERKAIEKAERKAERVAERGSRPPLDLPLDLHKWLKATQAGLLYLPLVLAALVAIMHVVNLRILASPMEKYVSEVVNEPVTIGQIRLSLLTSSLTLSEIKVESGADAGIGVIQLSPMVLLQSGKVRDLGVLEIEDIVVTRASIGRQLEWIKTLAQNKDKLSIEEVALKNVSFIIPGLELEPFEGRISRLAGGALGLIELESDDQRLNLKFEPINSQYKVMVNAAAWQPPFDTHLEFSELNAEGLLDAQQIRFDQIKAKLYSGTMTANVVIEWAGEPSITGGFELEGLSLPVALSSMKSAASVNGTLQAKGSFASTAGAVGHLADNLEINATFIALNGKINDVNLASKVTSGGSRDSTTRFDKLTGNVRFKDGYYQYTQLALKSNQFKAKGNLNIQPDQEITGKVRGELATPSHLIRSNLNLSGRVGSVKLN